MSRHLISPDNVWSAWSIEPLVVVTLLVSAALYARGLSRLWSVAERGAGVRRWEAAAFAAGLVVLAVALMSPLHAMGGVLFSAHMTQHELLISIAAPLLVLGRPLIPFVWAFSPNWRRTLGAWTRRRGVSGAWSPLSRPSIAFCLHAIALWVWHLPGLYQATLTSEVMHSLQHVTFIATALLFWWAILSARGEGVGRGAALIFLFLTLLQTGALGALLAFSPTLWYPAYAETARAWGLTPLEDQQLGGLIMWIPGSLVYLAAGLWIFGGWLRESESRSRWHDRAVLVALNEPASPPPAA
jgi:cytochrome c oxidase assembly factor CtaG